MPDRIVELTEENLKLRQENLKLQEENKEKCESIDFYQQLNSHSVKHISNQSKYIRILRMENEYCVNLIKEISQDIGPMCFDSDDTSDDPMPLFSEIPWIIRNMIQLLKKNNISFPRQRG